MILVLKKAWSEGFMTRSDFARQHAEAIAIAAYEGLITTLDDQGKYGRVWHITPAGLETIWEIIEPGEMIEETKED